MAMTDTKSDVAAKEKAAKKEGFDKWMDSPATRMMLSMIPPSEKPEVLETLLQETFNAGFSAGSGSTAGTLLEAIFKGMEKREPRI